MVRCPDHRYQAAKAAAAENASPGDARVEALAQLLAGDECPDPAVAYAYDLYTVNEHRMVVDAFILARAPAELVYKTLEIPPEVFSTYEHLFMDRGVFRNRLELLTYAAAYEGEGPARDLIRTAVTVGPDYLVWAYGQMRDFDNRLIIRQTMTDSFFRGLAHRGNAITSAVSKEAQKWLGNAVKNAELIERIDPRTSTNALDELKIALEVQDDTLTPDKAPVPVEDILH